MLLAILQDYLTQDNPRKYAKFNRKQVWTYAVSGYWIVSERSKDGRASPLPQKKLPRLTLGSGGESESLFNPLLPLEYSARLIQPVCWRERVDSYRAP